MILALVFRSYTQPVLIMIVIPFSCCGAIFGHWFLGHNITAISIFGIVALAGVVVNDSLVLIDFINQRIFSGATVMQALKECGPARFRAITLTTITTFVGLVPIMFSKNLHAQFIAPLAISLGFGLVFSTFIVLFFFQHFFSILILFVVFFTG